MARSGPGWCPMAEQVEGLRVDVCYSDAALLPVGFCDHTAGGFYSTMKSASFWNNAGVSTHFAIARDGRIAQMVNIFQTAFAQGRLGPKVTWAPWKGENPNTLFISTEHEDAETVNGQTRFIPGSQWTQAQYDADLTLKRWCVAEAKKAGLDVLKYGIDSLTGHHMFDGVNRAECPGRYWRNEYRQRLFDDLTNSSSHEGDDDMFTRLNAIAPSLQGKTVTGPLTVGLADFDTAIPQTSRARIEVYLRSGNVTVRDGVTQKYAGQVGWDGGRYGVVEVNTDGNGFILDGNGVLAQVGIVAVA